ncbi:MAG: ABC transporter permease [Kofleriaceae bacterium]
MSALAATIKKDLWLLLRDRGALMSLFALPIVFMLVFGSIFRFGADRSEPRALPVWHADDDARAAVIVAAIERGGLFRPERAASAEAARARVAREDVAAALVFPPGFDPAAGRPIELVIDQGAPLQVRGPIEGALGAAVRAALAPSAAPAPPALVARTPPGISKPLAGITSFQVTVPGNGVLFGFFLALTVAMSFTEERRSGTWRRLLASPVSRRAALLLKLGPFVVIGLLQLGFLFGVGALVFGMKVAGSVPALMLLSLAVVLCATSLGLAMASLGGSEKMLGGVGSVVLLVMGLLGGCMVPRLVMPSFLRSVGNSVPHSWALDGYYAVLVRDGTGVVDLAPQLAALLAFAAAFAAFGAWRFSFEDT